MSTTWNKAVSEFFPENQQLALAAFFGDFSHDYETGQSPAELSIREIMRDEKGFLEESGVKHYLSDAQAKELYPHTCAYLRLKTNDGYWGD